MTRDAAPARRRRIAFRAQPCAHDGLHGPFKVRGVASGPMKNVLSRDFVALILSVAVVGLGTGATLPLTALALTEAGHGTNVVGMLTAAQALGGLAIVPFVTALARRLGARRAIVVSVVLLAAATTLMQFTSNLIVWGVLRVLCGADAAVHDRRSVGQPARRRFDARPRGRDLCDQFHAVPDGRARAGQPDRGRHQHPLRAVRRAVPACIADARDDPARAAGRRRRAPGRPRQLARGAAAHARADHRHRFLRAVRHARAVAAAALRDGPRRRERDRGAARVDHAVRRHRDAVPDRLARRQARSRARASRRRLHRARGPAAAAVGDCEPVAVLAVAVRARRGGRQHLHAVAGRMRRALPRRGARHRELARLGIVERRELRRAARRRRVDGTTRQQCADRCAGRLRRGVRRGRIVGATRGVAARDLTRRPADGLDVHTRRRGRCAERAWFKVRDP
ncbi:membrane hypothetical protein [Burkholderia vietnamiensis]|nr:membrane hypothetical protein [Burkholderia vietnamiensis]